MSSHLVARVTLYLYTLITASQCIEINQSTRINFGSCNHQDYSDYHADTWKSIVSRKPDLFMWTGDAVYLDTEISESYPYADYSILLFAFNNILLGKTTASNPSTWPSKYNKMKQNHLYQNMKNSTEIIGIYDDHDMGANNVNYKFKHKDISQQLFLDFLNIPKNHPKRFQKGVYDYYQMKTQIDILNMTYSKTIDIILLDTRYFAKQDGEQDLLGSVQWEWFENTLQNKLSGELLIIVSGIQMMNRPPLYTIEGWYKYKSSQQKLFKLLKKYNTNDRLLLISGDVHRAEIMHSQCIGNETYDFYEITSSGITHSMFFETPMIERFTYTLDNYAREDGVMRCSWLGRNFGEINIDWRYDKNINDVKIKNVSVAILDENGNEKCILDLPLFGESNFYEYDDDSHSLWSNNFHTCYGAETFHSKHGVQSVRAICGLSWVIMAIYQYLYVFILGFILCEKIGLYCCNKLDIFGIDKPPPLSTRTVGGESINNRDPKTPVRNECDNAEFTDIGTVVNKTRSEPSLMNPNDLHHCTFHSHEYYTTYGYVLFKNNFYFYILLSIIFSIGFKFIGPYNTDYKGNLYVLITFGIIYCCFEMSLGYHCVYSFRIAKYLSMVTIFICIICMIISWIQYQEIIISVLFVMSDIISIVSSCLLISHGSMYKTYMLIIIFQCLVTGHKIYSLGSHLIYVHNDVENHSHVGWFWIIQTCAFKILLSQFIFRSKLQYITDILYDNLLIQRKKYKAFEILFPFILFIIFCICSFEMASNTNDWDEGYVSVGTFLEFVFMFNWPSVIFFLLWLGFKEIKIPKKHRAFQRQLTFKRVSHQIQKISLKMKEEFGNLANIFEEENNNNNKQEIGNMSPIPESRASSIKNKNIAVLQLDLANIEEDVIETTEESRNSTIVLNDEENDELEKTETFVENEIQEKEVDINKVEMTNMDRYHSTAL